MWRCAGITAFAAVVGPLSVAGCTGDGEPARPDFSLRFEQIALEGEPVALTDLRLLPGGRELLLSERSGTVHHYRLEGDSATKLGSFTIPDVTLDRECGLISMALDPAFEANRRLYLGWCMSKTHSRIGRVTFDPTDYAAIAETRTEILTVGSDEAEVGHHNVGEMGFEPDGTLWALFGEKTQAREAQNPANPLGALVRIVPKDDGGFEPASGNPFRGEKGSPIVYAYGLRSPWTGLRDEAGRYWIGDVGSDRFEELNLVTTPGQNFGWPEAEGDEGCPGCSRPLLSWSRQSDHPYVQADPEAVPTEQRIAWVGARYRSSAGDPYEGRLDGCTLYGDFAVGFVRSVRVDDEGNVLEDGHVGHLQAPSSWRQHPDGYLYVATFGDFRVRPARPGALYRVEVEGP